jgi:NADPH-dependent 2,4-dienoyl-CoA reductase/sulfur reductase-like enzyme
MKHIVIIGNGISGITAARHIRKRSDCKITVISSETPYFFSRTALMYIYMGHMNFEHTKPYEDWFWKKNRIDLVSDHVVRVDPGNHQITLQTGATIDYDQLIIATGSQPNRFGWPGEMLTGVQGLYSLQDLKKMEGHTRGIHRAVIVGGGLIGVEMAEMLRSRDIEVAFLVREPEFWSNVLPVNEARLISRHIRQHGVDLRLSTALNEIIDNGDGRAGAVVTTAGERIDCQFVGLTVGVSPNVAFLEGSGIETARGVLVNEFLQTNFRDVYAIGDCAERAYELPGRKAIEQVWYTGRMMGEVVAQTITGAPTRYEPGPWFNSAKFFDIEYQTYGHVPAVLSASQAEFYWEHHDGRKAMHLVWDKTSRVFEGINSFGIRQRHACFDRWLRDKVSVDFVVEHLPEANFDPEFFERHESEIAASFQSKRLVEAL